jgi:hypothetical protein
MQENKGKQDKNAKGKRNQGITTRAKAIADGNGLVIDENDKDDKYSESNGLFNEFAVVAIERYAASGLNNTEIAKALGIGRTTLYDWMERYPNVMNAIKKYRGLANIEVENALYKSAVGFTFVETKKEGRKDPENPGQYKLVVTEEIEKTFAPNTAACIFYLKNRMPERYKDKIETEISLGQDIGSLAFAVKRRE